MILTFFLLSFGPLLTSQAPTKWIHPGVLVDSTRLAYIKSQLPYDPFKTAYEKALNSKYANKSYVPLGPPTNGVIECGSYNNPDYGCTAEDSDGSAAYLQLLLFYLTNETVYATNAVKILNAYQYPKVTKYNNSNAPLQAAWGASKWNRAAELAFYLPGVNWNLTNSNAFRSFLVNVSLPYIYGGSGSNGNWELSMIEGMFGIATFMENSTLFDHAVTYWKQRVPSYFYCDSIDKGTPVPTPRGNPGWYGQTVFNASTTGHCQETCRDENHVSLGLAACMNGAETAYIQGTDLYSLEALRLTQGMEYNSYWQMGYKPPTYICNGTIGVYIQPTYEIGYNAFVHRSTYKLPNSSTYIVQKVRTMVDPVEPHMIIYETLTHGGSPPSEMEEI